MAPLHEISQAKILEGLPFLSPEDLRDPGVETMSPELAGGVVYH